MTRRRDPATDHDLTSHQLGALQSLALGKAFTVEPDAYGFPRVYWCGTAPIGAAAVRKLAAWGYVSGATDNATSAPRITPLGRVAMRREVAKQAHRDERRRKGLPPIRPAAAEPVANRWTAAQRRAHRFPVPSIAEWNADPDGYEVELARAQAWNLYRAARPDDGPDDILSTPEGRAYIDLSADLCQRLRDKRRAS